MALTRLPFFNGLGILVPQQRATPALQAVIDGFFEPAMLLETCERLERDAMQVRTDMAAQRLILTQRTEMLVRARSRIAELEQALARSMAG